jgi:hypothetical protein
MATSTARATAGDGCLAALPVLCANSLAMANPGSNRAPNARLTHQPKKTQVNTKAVEKMIEQQASMIAFAIPGIPQAMILPAVVFFELTILHSPLPEISGSVDIELTSRLLYYG